MLVWLLLMSKTDTGMFLGQELGDVDLNLVDFGLIAAHWQKHPISFVKTSRLSFYQTHISSDNSVGSIVRTTQHVQFSNLASSLNLLSLWMVVLAVTAAVVAS